jgi:hypothetical protein
MIRSSMIKSSFRKSAPCGERTIPPRCDGHRPTIRVPDHQVPIRPPFPDGAIGRDLAFAPSFPACLIEENRRRQVPLLGSYLPVYHPSLRSASVASFVSDPRKPFSAIEFPTFRKNTPRIPSLFPLAHLSALAFAFFWHHLQSVRFNHIFTTAEPAFTRVAFCAYSTFRPQLSCCGVGCSCATASPMTQ